MGMPTLPPFTHFHLGGRFSNSHGALLCDPLRQPPNS